MTLRNLTTDNSVRYVSNADILQSESIPKNFKSSKPKTASNPRKQINELSQKKIIKNVTGDVFKRIK